MSLLRELLVHAIASDASDIHITAGRAPYYRIHGTLLASGFEPIDEAGVRAIVDDILPQHAAAKYAEEKEIDFSFREPDVGRFRVCVFHGEGVPAIALRHVKSVIPPLEDLNLPETLHRLADFPSGLVILSGTTGCGKSTTLAAVVEEINTKHDKRIVTIEDPVEFAFESKRSIITQREVGLDTPDFVAALRHVLRQDPDVILIGEMRDVETVRVALLAAETGHLVLSTLHAGTAAIAVPRLLDLFPLNEQEQIRMAIANTLRAVVCQKLVPAKNGGVVPAAEVMFNTPTVAKLIAKNQLNVLGAAIETGLEDGMQTFNQSLYQWIQDGDVSKADGLKFATNPESLEMNLRGIFLDESRKILSSLV